MNASRKYPGPVGGAVRALIFVFIVLPLGIYLVVAFWPLLIFLVVGTWLGLAWRRNNNQRLAEMEARDKAAVAAQHEQNIVRAHWYDN